jgi:hypothetical protein
MLPAPDFQMMTKHGQPVTDLFADPEPSKVCLAFTEDSTYLLFRFLGCLEQLGSVQQTLSALAIYFFPACNKL